MVMATTTFIVMILQALGALALWLVLRGMIAKRFDKDGNRKI
jgi:hypothetical protein